MREVKGLESLGVGIGAVERDEIVTKDTALVTRLIMAPIVMSAVWHAVFALNDDEAQVDLEALFRMHADFLLNALTSKASK
jgi:hypothetical protein